MFFFWWFYSLLCSGFLGSWCLCCWRYLVKQKRLLAAWVEFCAFSDRMFGSVVHPNGYRVPLWNHNCILQGRIQDFKLVGVQLKKLHRAEGGVKIFGVFRVKNHIFSNFRGSAPVLGNKYEMRSVWTLQASHKVFRRSMVLLFLEVIPHFRVSWYLSSFYPSSQN